MECVVFESEEERSYHDGDIHEEDQTDKQEKGVTKCGQLVLNACLDGQPAESSDEGRNTTPHKSLTRCPLWETVIIFTGSPYLGRALQPQQQRHIPIPVSVCSIFVCPNNGVAASLNDF